MHKGSTHGAPKPNSNQVNAQKISPAYLVINIAPFKYLTQALV